MAGEKITVTLVSYRGKYPVGKTTHIFGDIFQVDAGDKKAQDALKANVLRRVPETDIPKEFKESTKPAKGDEDKDTKPGDGKKG